MRPRLELQKKLEEILGSRNVYFQPPSNLTMRYPCIRYSLRDIDTRAANNNPYKFDTSYELTYIDENPDSDIPMKLASLTMCTMLRSYVYDGLNCYVFVIHYK